VARGNAGPTRFPDGGRLLMGDCISIFESGTYVEGWCILTGTFPIIGVLCAVRCSEEVNEKGESESASAPRS
jgi:hypothetical protein